MFRPVAIACTAAILASLGFVVQADAGQPPEATKSNELTTAASAKVPLREAVATAEQHLNGKAVRADFETEDNSQGVYNIEVVTGTKVFDVRIDADKGTVLAANEDKADRDHDDEEAD